MRTKSSSGFSLIEILLVLFVIGVITAIAVPSLLGQRQKAKRIGDAESNARTIAMGMEAYKTETGIYGAAGATATWTPGAAAPTLVGYTVSPVPSFKAAGNSQMTYVVTAQPMTYTLMVSSNGQNWVSFDQTGAKTLYIK